MQCPSISSAELIYTRDKMAANCFSSSPVCVQRSARHHVSLFASAHASQARCNGFRSSQQGLDYLRQRSCTITLAKSRCVRVYANAEGSQVTSYVRINSVVSKSDRRIAAVLQAPPHHLKPYASAACSFQRRGCLRRLHIHENAGFPLAQRCSGNLLRSAVLLNKFLRSFHMLLCTNGDCRVTGHISHLVPTRAQLLMFRI